MTPNEIRAQQFARQLVGGLSSEEVSAFLEDVADAFAAVQKQNVSLTAKVTALEAEVRARPARENHLVQQPVTGDESGAAGARGVDTRWGASEQRGDETLRAAEAQAESVIRAAREQEASALSRIDLLRTAALQEVEALLHDAQARTQALTEQMKEREAALLQEAEVVKARMVGEAEHQVAESLARAESVIAAAREQEVDIRNEIDRLTQRRLQLVDDVRATLDSHQQWLETVDPRGRARGRGAFEMSQEGSDALSSPDGARAG